MGAEGQFGLRSRHNKWRWPGREGIIGMIRMGSQGDKLFASIEAIHSI